MKGLLRNNFYGIIENVKIVIAECPECLAWQDVQRAQRGLLRRCAAGK